MKGVEKIGENVPHNGSIIDVTIFSLKGHRSPKSSAKKHVY